MIKSDLTCVRLISFLFCSVYFFIVVHYEGPNGSCQLAPRGISDPSLQEFSRGNHAQYTYNNDYCGISGLRKSQAHIGCRLVEWLFGVIFAESRVVGFRSIIVDSRCDCTSSWRMHDDQSSSAASRANLACLQSVTTNSWNQLWTFHSHSSTKLGVPWCMIGWSHGLNFSPY